MITRENIIEKMKDFKAENKCAIYLEVPDAKNSKAWAYGTGDPSIQVRAMAQYLISLADTLNNSPDWKEKNVKVTPYQLAQDIAKMVDTEPRIEGHITKVVEGK